MRLHAMSKYLGSISIPINLRPILAHATEWLKYKDRQRSEVSELRINASNLVQIRIARSAKNAAWAAAIAAIIAAICAIIAISMHFL